MHLTLRRVFMIMYWLRWERTVPDEPTTADTCQNTYEQNEVKGILDVPDAAIKVTRYPLPK